LPIQESTADQERKRPSVRFYAISDYAIPVTLADFSGVISPVETLYFSGFKSDTWGTSRTKDLRRGTATMDKKEIRRIAQHRFASQQSNEDSWYGSAISFHEGAEILWQHTDSIRRGVLVVLMNAALSIELLLKAIIIAKGGVAPQTHELLDLARDADIAFSKSQKATLELLGEVLKWSGRYPVPNTEKAWDRYYDHVLERHVIREREGNIGRVRANPETFPSVKNYEALWNLAIRKWDEIHPQ